MNILINNKCNIKCPYCFAHDYMSNEKSEMSFINFKIILDFLKNSNYPYCRFQGGEPTLHKDFTLFAEYAIKKGFNVKIFSNCLFNSKVRGFIKKNKENLSFTLNINNPRFYSNEQWSLIQENLNVIQHKKSAIGINIYKASQEHQYVLDIAKNFDFQAIRIGLTHSCNSTTTYCSMKNLKPYFDVINQIIGKAINIRKDVHLECGITPCQAFKYIPKDFLRNKRLNIINCLNCPAVDYRLDVLNCFQSRDINEKKKLSNFKDLYEIYDYLDEVRTNYGEIKLYPYCSESCYFFFNNWCKGGCLADKKYLMSNLLKKERIKSTAIPRNIKKSIYSNKDFYLIKETLKHSIETYLSHIISGKISQDKEIERFLDYSIKKFDTDGDFFIFKTISLLLRNKKAGLDFLFKNCPRYFDFPYREDVYHNLFKPLIKILEMFKLESEKRKFQGLVYKKYLNY